MRRAPRQRSQESPAVETDSGAHQWKTFILAAAMPSTVRISSGIDRKWLTVSTSMPAPAREGLLPPECGAATQSSYRARGSGVRR